MNTEAHRMENEQEPFDRSELELLPLSEREHDLDLSVISKVEPRYDMAGRFAEVAERIVTARGNGASVILMMGAHVLRSGVQRYLIDLMENGHVDCVATNGACSIHDWEFALIGKTTESVSKYIKDGRFGFWKETGRINDIVAAGAKKNMGLGESVGKAILEQELPHRDISLFATAFRNNIPITVHVGIGHDITHQHPNFDGAAYGAASYSDFMRLVKVIEKLEDGVLMVFGSSVMAPEVFLKGLSMARNIARQKGKTISRFTTLVCDLVPLPETFRNEPDREDPRYFFRPWKTLLVRMVQDGGRSYYIQGTHADTIPALWTAIKEAESSKLIAQSGSPDGSSKQAVFAEKMEGKATKVIGLSDLARQISALKDNGKTIVHCHGCFDLMHPGHIKYFQAAKKMGDILVVTVTPDRFVDKGPGRPVFGEQLRAESIAALACVDYVAVNRWPTAEETLRYLKPHYYVKGQEFETLRDKTGKIQKEYAVAEDLGIQVRFTHEIVFSSTDLLNRYFLPSTEG